MALTPWPAADDAAGVEAAVVELRRAAGVNAVTLDADVGRYGAVASALVEAHAPGAPQAVRDEAVVRTASWMLHTPAASIDTETVGPFTQSYIGSQTGALRHSGSMSLLAPWRVRRAGPIA